MRKTDQEARFDGQNETATDGTQLMGSGVLPEDFGERLERLREASGLSWRGLARAIGVDPKQQDKWRKRGVEPCGGAMLSLCRFASRMPGGMEILADEDFRKTPFEKQS